MASRSGRCPARDRTRPPRSRCAAARGARCASPVARATREPPRRPRRARARSRRRSTRLPRPRRWRGSTGAPNLRLRSGPVQMRWMESARSLRQVVDICARRVGSSVRSTSVAAASIWPHIQSLIRQLRSRNEEKLWSWLPASLELASLRVWSNCRSPVGLSPFGSGRTVAKRGSGSASSEGQVKDAASGVPALPEIVRYRMRSRLPRASPRWRGSRAKSIWSSARLAVLGGGRRRQEPLQCAPELVPGRGACDRGLGRAVGERERLLRLRHGARHQRRKVGGDRDDLVPLLDDAPELFGDLRDPSTHDQAGGVGIVMGKVGDLLERVDVECGGGAHRGVAQVVEAQLLRPDGVDDTRGLRRRTGTIR